MDTRWLIAAAILSIGFYCPQARERSGKLELTETSVTATIEHAVIQAIEDEIYDWGCQNSVDFVGREISRDEYELPVYMNPIIRDGRGEVIYKFMPIGSCTALSFPKQMG